MSTPAPPRRRRVLLVDDQPANVEVLAAALEDAYDLSVATSGARALEIVGSARIDLVLLDVVMPEMDGYEVCRRLKATPETRDVPVIFVTGLGEVADEMTGFEIGGVDYITKPVSMPVVRARVRTHLELKEQRDLLATLAATDSLTGIANRRHFDQSLTDQWRRALRDERPFSLLLLDVDDFKLFNDQYGHGKGDECLQSIAQVLDRSFRRTGDVVARYGGEEFAAVLPGLEAQVMVERVGELLGSIEDLAIPHLKARAARHVTVSVGAVSLRPVRELEPALLVRLADELLYGAKEAGRNRGIHLDRDRDLRSVVRRDGVQQA